MGVLLANRTVAVPAGATGVVLDIGGRFVKIVSCTVGSILIGLDKNTPERVYADDVIEGTLHGFRQLRFVSDLGACTVVVQVSDNRLSSSAAVTTAALLVQMTGAAASLVNIDADMELLKPGTVPTQIDPTVIPVSPAVAVQLVAAGGVKQIMLQAGAANTDPVYLSFTNNADDTHHFAPLYAGESVSIPHNVNVWARCAAGAGAANEVHGYAIS